MQIYIFKNNEQFGPFDTAQIEDYIKTNIFDINDFAWSEGEPEWIPLSDLLLKQTNIQDVEDVGISPSPAEIQLSQEEEAKILTAEIAGQFLKNSDAVALSEFTTIEDYAACVLARHKGEIWLNGLKSLSDAAARLLSEHKGFLSLNGLEFLSDESARALAYHGGEISDLSVLEGLNDAAAKFITAEPATARQMLAQHGRLDLAGLTSLSDAAAEALSIQKGFLNLSGLRSLSDSSAEALSRHEGFLDLSGLAILSDSSARSLANVFRKGFLWLEGQAEEECKVARTRAREALKTAINFANQILSSSESINPNKMRTQILELEKLYDIAGVPKNSREGVKQIKKALAELETKIAQAKAQSQAQARAKAKALADARAQAAAKVSEPMSDKVICGIWCVSSIVVCVITWFWFSSFTDPVSDADKPLHATAWVTAFISTLSSLISLIILGNWENGGAPSNETITFLQRQQMINRLNDIRNDLNDE